MRKENKKIDYKAQKKEKRREKKKKRKENRENKKQRKAAVRKASIAGTIAVLGFVIYVLYTGIQLNVEPEITLQGKVTYNAEKQGFNITYLIENVPNTIISSDSGEVNLDENGNICGDTSKKCFVIEIDEKKESFSKGTIQNIELPRFIEKDLFYGMLTEEKQYMSVFAFYGKIINDKFLIYHIEAK